jgi:cytochrome c
MSLRIPGLKEIDMKKLVGLAFALALSAAGAGQALAAGDAAAGEKVFAKCKACHQIGETAKNGVGPQLNGIVGRKSGQVEGYSYSDANKNSGLTFDAATLDSYLTNPKAKIPGTKMVFAGLPEQADRDNLVAYLAQFGADGKKK